MSTIPLDLGLDEGIARYAGFGGENNCYRYVLGRCWEKNGYQSAVCFVGLNPSTADSSEDDPTIRRMMGYARSWGYGAITVVNLFAIRATEPSDMKRHPDPIGYENDLSILKAVAEAKLVIACWGTHGGHMNRDRSVMPLLTTGYRCHCLLETKDGFPSHPLYLPSNLTPKPYTGRPS